MRGLRARLGLKARRGLRDYPALLEFPGHREHEERKALPARIAVRLAPRVSKGLRVTWEGRARKG